MRKTAGLSHAFYAGMVEWSNTSDCKSDGVRLRGFKSLSLHQYKGTYEGGFFYIEVENALNVRVNGN